MLFYIHIPFCSVRCRYCAFYSQALGKKFEPEALQGFIDSLFLELALQAERFGKIEVDSIFFGGGTPSLLPPKIIHSILDRINRYFSLNQGAEITLEANPESLRTHQDVIDFLSAGVNRLSIGIQTMDEELLRLLGRVHHAKDSLHTLLIAREAGCTNLSTDLMWGLPGQGVRQWLQTVKDIVRLSPDHISAYGLSLEPGTELEKICARDNLQLPPELDMNIMYMEAADILEDSGYIHYEISNFAKMGFQCLHNIGYWEGREYLGFGPSATSTVGNRRWTNPLDLKEWANEIKTKKLGSKVEILTPRIRVLEMIMLRLRTMRGLRLKAYNTLTGRDFMKDNQRLVQALYENGLIRLRDGFLSLTRKGMLVSNAIFTNLFEKTDELLDDTTNMPTVEDFGDVSASSEKLADGRVVRPAFPGAARKSTSQKRKIIPATAQMLTQTKQSGEKSLASKSAKAIAAISTITNTKADAKQSGAVAPVPKPVPPKPVQVKREREQASKSAKAIAAMSAITSNQDSQQKTNNATKGKVAEAELPIIVRNEAKKPGANLPPRAKGNIAGAGQVSVMPNQRPKPKSNN